jgi:hypothetical protein
LTGDRQDGHIHPLGVVMGHYRAATSADRDDVDRLHGVIAVPVMSIVMAATPP